MSETSTTTNPAERTGPLAGLGVAMHAANYDLPYFGFDLPDRVDEPAITIRVQGEHLDAWLDSIIVTGDPVVRTPAELSVGRELVIYRGELLSAIGYIPVIIWSARAVPLHLVGAAS